MQGFLWAMGRFRPEHKANVPPLSDLSTWCAHAHKIFSIAVDKYEAASYTLIIEREVLYRMTSY
jgi:hypothetical protein